MTERRRRRRVNRPRAPFFSSGPCAKPPGWAPQKLATGSLGRSHRSKLGKARLGHAIELTRHVLGVPRRHRIGIVPASDTGAVEMAMWTLLGAAAGDPARLGELRRGLGHRRRQAAEARREGDARALWRASRPRRRRSGERRRLHLERHHLGRARPRRRLDRRRPRRPHHLRRHLGGLRDGPALGQARCRHLVLAEGAGRRGGARHADPLAARGRAAGELQARLAAAQDLPPDQGRQADRRHLPGRDHQHALDAGGRG